MEDVDSKKHCMSCAQLQKVSGFLALITTVKVYQN